MAAALAIDAGLVAESAGALPGFTVATNAVEVVSELCGVDIAGHTPRSVETLDLSGFGRIVAMDAIVADELTALGLPDLADDLVVWDIADPYGQSIDVYRRCAESIIGRLCELEQ